MVALAALASVLCSGARPDATSTARAATITCDYSFIVRQPIFELVAPEESGTDVSLATPLGVQSDGSFAIIKQVELVPDTGNPIVLAPTFKPFTPTSPLHKYSNFASPQTVIQTMSLPRLKPSTTYDVVFLVKTQSAPSGCPKALTEHIARFTTESATSLDAIALSTEPVKAPTGGPPTGPEIFDNALHVLRALDYPAVVSFIVTSRSTVGGKPFIEEFRSSLRTSDDVVITHSVPIATTNQPENPWGWRINIPILSSLFPSQRKGNFSQPFGVPEISPTYAFGLLPRAPVSFPGMPQDDTDTQDADVKSLGRILTIARDYEATLLDVEPYHDRYVYHIKLTPIARPDYYRLREAWVDTQAFIIWKLRSQGIFDEGPATTVPWDAEYTVVDGHWFMSTEYTASTIRTGGFLANTPPVNYDGVTYTFSDFDYPEDSLDLDFFSEVKTQAIQY
ncbi:MAG TPA: hypothetical protein VEJ41_03205 [Candidatus Acidoferrales bacterium]|nr:hypothetical protein [Candidatus Acidoferrales bacterium]